MVAREDRENIVTTGTAVTQEWDAAWESDGEPNETSSEDRNRHSLDEERKLSEVFSKSIYLVNQVSDLASIYTYLFLSSLRHSCSAYPRRSPIQWSTFRQKSTDISSAPAATPDEEIDDAADAWGWNDDDDTTEAEPKTVLEAAQKAPSPPPDPQDLSPATREMTITEKYWITSFPQPVYKTVSSIYEEGAKLTQPEFVLLLQFQICTDSKQK